MAETTTMYMHTLDGKPASFSDWHGHPSLYTAGNGHASRAAILVPSRRQIEREQQACIAEDWQYWTAMRPEYRPEQPSAKRYGYVLVKVPAAASPEGR